MTAAPDDGRSAGTAIWVGFSAMTLGMFMAVLDIQIVVTSLPEIREALAIAPDKMSWIQTAYLIAEVIAIPLTGLLTRVLSLRRLFVAALLLFTLASAACAASGGFESLIVARVVQGFAGGVLIPSVFSAVFLLFPFRQQGIATTLAGVMAVLAPTVGPLVGGWITQTYSWHWLFLVNVLPGIAAALVAGRFLPREAGEYSHARTIDIAGLLLMALALAALEIGLKDAPKHGWDSVPGARPVRGLGARGLCLRAPQPAAGPAGGRSDGAARPQLRDRLLALLHAGHRPLRLGLSDAGVPELCARARPARDRPDHAGHRRWPSSSPRRSPSSSSAGSTDAS